MINIGALIREYLADPALDGPTEVAAEVDKRLTDADRLELFPGFLRERCREEIRHVRAQRDPLPVKEPETPAEAPTARAVRSGHGSTRTGRVALINRWRTKLAQDRQPVGDNVWKALANCTLVDVQNIAQHYHDLAAANGMEAARFDRLKVEMERRNVAVVANLPDSVLEDHYR